jgi:hypothetical protein
LVSIAAAASRYKIHMTVIRPARQTKTDIRVMRESGHLRGMAVLPEMRGMGPRRCGRTTKRCTGRPPVRS